MKTYTYKKVGDLEIRADVYRPDDDTTRPVAVWIHGGALIMGHRVWIDTRAKDLLLRAGYAVVSIDYRLAPETQLPEIIADLEDAFVWIEREGPQLFNVDTSHIAVLGGSAGGYLTLTAGFRAKPRPTVLVSFCGYGDLVGEWYSQPSPHERHHGVTLSQDEAFEQVSGPPISDASERKGDGGAFYQFCRQKGLWPEAVSGWDPHTEADRFRPYMAIGNVTQDYPPTMLIHGTDDTDVPYEQSAMMAGQLQENGVEHQLVTIPGAEHGLQDGAKQTIDSAYESMLTFVNHHMGR
ncbi:MAG: alpha/beta hydrolase [Gemmatimonadetes bacterium]|jgi:acetyl esterase/lipase|nr:alpha/beta hydrolase [Gemmatimonadota bacterium]MBT7861634.1 alpha/beta hydrolase [Gemmatimonadota bacterium]